MRIAISGTANTGKTTLVQDFLKRWPTFKTVEKTYRHFLKNGEHSSKTTSTTQRTLAEWFIEQIKQFGPEDNVIFDRCTLDVLVHTLWGVHHETISAKFADEIIPQIKESLRNLDIIFYIPFDDNIPIVDDGIRDTDVTYIKEIDAFFRIMYEDYIKADKETFIIFPKDDMPAFIPINGSREQRIAQIAEYVDPLGGVVETNPDTSVFSDQELKKMEEFVKLQEQFNREDKFGIN